MIGLEEYENFSDCLIYFKEIYEGGFSLTLKYDPMIRRLVEVAWKFPEGLF